MTKELGCYSERSEESGIPGSRPDPSLRSGWQSGYIWAFVIRAL